MDELEQAVYDMADVCCEHVIVLNTKTVSRHLGITKYKARKLIHSMVEKGILQKVSLGRPAVVWGYEDSGDVSEAMPPLNGYCIVTELDYAKRYPESVATLGD